MRRLAQHAIVGVGFSAFVATAAVAGLSSPGEEAAAIAVPAPIVAISTSATASDGIAADDRAAERAAAKTRDNREATRAQLIAAKHAAKRAKSLGLETKAIAAQEAKIKAELAAAAKRAAEEKAARERALRNRGYEPGVTDPARRLFDAYAAEVARVDANGDGVLTFVEAEPEEESDGQSNERLFLPATSFNRFAVTRELDDGLLAPRLAPSQRAYVLTGSIVKVSPAVPASIPRDADNR